MARIVKPDPADYLRTQCDNCFVKVEYSPDEVQSGTHYDYGGGSDTVYYIKCPRCGEDISVSHPLRHR